MRPIASATAFAFVLALSAAASAQTQTPTVNCVAPGRSNVVYVTGSSALKPFLASLAPLLAADSGSYTIVYQSQGSCTGVNNIYSTNDDPSTGGRIIKDIGGAKPNYPVFFKADGSTQECWADGVMGANYPAGPYPYVDVGASDVYASSCGAMDPGGGITIGDFHGPIQPMTLVVPAASTQKSISAEAAYLAFGRGENNPSTLGIPWIDPTYFFVRNASSGTQQMVARAIGVPANQWFGIDRGGSGAVQTGVKVIVDPATAEKAIGILSVDLADAERSNMRILAFKARGQSCAYLPDSNINSHDKINVRDGHYPIWGPVHLYARTSGGLPNTAASALLGRFSTPKLDPSLVDAVASKGLVPQCAMKVSRTEEMGPFASYQPPFGCGCYYDLKANGATSCKTCKATSDCPATAPACNYGYCEVQ